MSRAEVLFEYLTNLSQTHSQGNSQSLNQRLTDHVSRTKHEASGTRRAGAPKDSLHSSQDSTGGHQPSLAVALAAGRQRVMAYHRMCAGYRARGDVEGLRRFVDRFGTLRAGNGSGSGNGVGSAQRLQNGGR